MLFTAIPSQLYCQDLTLDTLMDSMTSDLLDLYENGLQVKFKEQSLRFKFVLLAVKGDEPPAPFLRLPTIAYDRGAVKPDVAHTYAIVGWGKDLAASSLILLYRLRVFPGHDVTNAGANVANDGNLYGPDVGRSLPTSAGFHGRLPQHASGQLASEQRIQICQMSPLRGRAAQCVGDCPEKKRLPAPRGRSCSRLGFRLHSMWVFACILAILCRPNFAASLDKDHEAIHKQIQIQVQADGSLSSMAAAQVMRRQKGQLLTSTLDVSNRSAPELGHAEKDQSLANQTNIPSPLADQSLANQTNIPSPLADVTGGARERKLLQSEASKVSLAAVLLFGTVVTTGLGIAGFLSYLLVAPRVVMKRRPITQAGSAGMYRRSSEKEGHVFGR
ncbi:hypothetical protein AK812_SmicGene41085 [Symbiodinium microadriaticum]|uniref:Uncharacterized protein n=1 Tax=Symbiodinium microadriaticum TaxID=2951 RepID=A0A1Q9C720_SYMMI|nr:hypothetical protein AK812_SmicGene41085 [Symbiodinium microadriaticum]